MVIIIKFCRWVKHLLYVELCFVLMQQCSVMPSTLTFVTPANVAMPGISMPAHADARLNCERKVKPTHENF